MVTSSLLFFFFECRTPSGDTEHERCGVGVVGGLHAAVQHNQTGDDKEGKRSEGRVAGSGRITYGKKKKGGRRDSLGSLLLHLCTCMIRYNSCDVYVCVSLLCVCVLYDFLPFVNFASHSLASDLLVAGLHSWPLFAFCLPVTMNK